MGKFYRTNAGLSHNQYVILVKIKEGFLCIDSMLGLFDENGSGYIIGELTDIYWSEVEECEYNIEDSPLYNKFFVKFLLEE